MTVVELPQTCTSDALLEKLSVEGLLEEAKDEVEFTVRKDCFISCGALAFLATWGLHYIENGCQIHFRGDRDVMRYMARMDLFKHLQVSYDETFNRHDATGRFTPIRLIAEEEDVSPATDSILELVLRQFESAREFVPALEWVVNETVDNIQLHAEAPVPGAVCAQYFRKRHRLDVAICDVGRGITASLESKLNPWEGHGDAIKKALQRGVTRDENIGQGNGLAGALEITEKNLGQFRIWTGDVVYETRNGAGRRFQQRPNTPGTGLVFRLDTRRPVDLSQTFMGTPTWTYIDAEVMRIEAEGRILVSDDCLNTGTRRPARRLRRKIQNILPDMEEPLVLDFDGVDRASSSFLDELLGRLVAELGAETFNKKISLANMPPEMVDMANVVIEQRLDSHK